MVVDGLAVIDHPSSSFSFGGREPDRISAHLPFSGTIRVEGIRLYCSKETAASVIVTTPVSMAGL